MEQMKLFVDKRSLFEKLYSIESCETLQLPYTVVST